MSLAWQTQQAAEGRAPVTDSPGPLDALVRDLIGQSRPRRGVVVAVASAVDGEGKTTIAHALARALGAAATPERPVVLFGATMALADFIEWQRRLAEWRVEYRFLSDLLSGSDEQSVAAAVTALRELRLTHPFAVLDLPSLLNFEQAAAVTRWVDQTFLVVRGGVTPSEVARRALRLIDRDRFGGVILNDFASPPAPARD